MTLNNKKYNSDPGDGYRLLQEVGKTLTSSLELDDVLGAADLSCA